MALPFAGVSFLVVGHICYDLVGEGKRVGGCAAYAALTAHRLGADTYVLTAAGPDLVLPAAFSGIHIACQPAVQTTTFRNIYEGGARRQELHGWAGPIVAEPPAECPRPDVVLLGPLANEVPLSLSSHFPTSLVGLSPQGWMRQWDAVGRVDRLAWPGPGEQSGAVDAMVLSQDDVGGDADLLASYARQVPVLVATQGYMGADLYLGAEVRHYPAWPATEVDPTGAGDIFAAAFMLQLFRHRDAGQAVGFASLVAGLSVEVAGLDGVPLYGQVERALQHSYPN